MKRIMKMSAFALIVVLSSSLLYSANAQYDDDYYDNSRDVDYQTFYDELSPHGNWIEYPGHGYVWQPSMGQDFRPYSTGGHWVWSDNYEWVWVSDYDWGWAPFHYGRWFSDPNYGWLWVPGYEWSGAWVTWRDGGDYYGWAPIRPGISININFNIGGYSPPVDWWCFTPRRYILSRNIYNHCIDYRRNVTIINHTTIINNYHYGDRNGWRTGPRRIEAERYVGRINPVRFRQSSAPGRAVVRNNEVSIFRPNVRQQGNSNGVAPRKFDRYDRDGNNGTVRNNNANNNIRGNRDNREGNVRSNNDFRNGRGTREGNVSTNEQPDRTIRPQGNNNGNNTRRFERTKPENNNGQPNNDNRVIRPDRTPRNTDVNSNPGNNGTRRFERRENSNQPVRQPAIRTQENNNNVRPDRQPSQQMERRQSPQFERRQQAPQQMERRQSQQRVEQPRQQQQQPSRQVERRSAPERSSQQGKESNGRGNGNGKRRF